MGAVHKWDQWNSYTLWDDHVNREVELNVYCTRDGSPTHGGGNRGGSREIQFFDAVHRGRDVCRKQGDNIYHFWEQCPG